MMIDQDPSSELVHALWPAVASGSAEAVLDGLLARGIRALPDFALVTRSADRVFVWRRGQITVSVVRRGSAVSVAAGSTTFSEQVFDGVERVEIGEPVAASGLPVVAGVVRAGFVTYDLDPQPFAAPVAFDAPQSARPAYPPSVPAEQFAPASIHPSPSAAFTPSGIIDGLPAYLSHPVGVTPSVVEMPRFEASQSAMPGRHFGDTTAGSFGDHVVDARPLVPHPGVAAVRCGDGHLNDRNATRCRVCGAMVPEHQLILDLDHIGSLGRLVRLDTGETHDIQMPRTIIGRDPRGPEGTALVRVDGASERIADIHLEIRVKGFTVEAADGRAASGVWVTNPGRPAVRLEPGTPVPLYTGASIELGREVTYRFEAV